MPRYALAATFTDNWLVHFYHDQHWLDRFAIEGLRRQNLDTVCALGRLFRPES